MAYSDYGGYAYRNGERVEERSDAQISPDGDIFGSPGIWSGFSAALAGGKDEYERRKDWPSGHVVLGDGPIYAAMHKQSNIQLYRGAEAIDMLAALKDAGPDAIESWEHDGKTRRYLNTEHFTDTEELCSFEIEGWRLDVYFRNEDNYYQYAQLTQPDGNVWHGWSGYGVGAGLEDCGYGYSTLDREREIWRLFERPKAPNAQLSADILPRKEPQ